jgi:hypothetical protein
VAAGRVKDFDKKKIIERRPKTISKPRIFRLTETAEADLAEIWARPCCSLSILCYDL